MTKENINNQLENDILDFKQKMQAKQMPKINPKTSKNISFIYGAFADISAGILTAFILYNIYQHFFSKNTMVFAILLIFCILGGFYGTIKTFIGKKYPVNTQKKSQ